MERPPGHRALRRGRISERGRTHHVTFATARRVPWFRDYLLARAACRMLAASAIAAESQWLCWMLMPDHVHGMLQLDGLACRRVRGKHIEVWGRWFHDHAMRRDEDLRAAARYIVANPVRAGLVKRSMDYPYWDAAML